MAWNLNADDGRLRRWPDGWVPLEGGTMPTAPTTPRPPSVSEETRRLWAQLANHIEACEKPLAECRPCFDAYQLQPL